MPENKKNKAGLLRVRNIKLTLEYDGTGFYGFQRQTSGVPTVQQALENAIEQLFQKKILLTSVSSRTDAGVHAEGQIAHFKIATELSAYRILRALNHFLPLTISVMKAEDAHENFHARFQPISKIYEYRIWNDSSRPALWRGYAFHEPTPLDVEAMKKAIKILIGKHDFRAFTSEEQIVKSRNVSRKKISFVRTIKKFKVLKKGRMVLFTVEADGFLYHMVRNLVGTLSAVGKGKLKPEDVKRILKTRNRKLAAETMPACGLILKKVRYP